MRGRVARGGKFELRGEKSSGADQVRRTSLKERESRVVAQRRRVVEKDVWEDIERCNKEKGRDGEVLVPSSDLLIWAPLKNTYFLRDFICVKERD